MIVATVYRQLSFGLSPEIELLREQVSRFARQHIAPHAATIDREERFPAQLWPDLGQLGVLGITVSEAYGGADMGYLAHVVAMEEISKASAAVGLSYGAHANLCVNQIFRHGNEVQRRRYLPPLIHGQCMGALAISEPEAGSDAMAMRLRATRCGDCYFLNGRKMWITNGPDADTYVIFAKTDPDAGSKGITAFIVERRFPGFASGARLDKLGMRGSGTCELTFDDCRVPAANVLGVEGGGTAILMSGLDLERVVLAGGPLGIMAACLELVIPYVRQRHQFGRPIATFQLVQGKLADMYTKLCAARGYVYAAAAACDRGEITPRDAAGALLYSAERATECALDAIQLLGGNGYVNDFPAGRLLRDAKLYEIGAGTSEIRRMLIGRALCADER